MTSDGVIRRARRKQVAAVTHAVERMKQAVMQTKTGIDVQSQTSGSGLYSTGDMSANIRHPS